MLICIVVTFSGYQSGYFYLMAIIGILPASDEPPISEPHDSLISRSPIQSPYVPLISRQPIACIPSHFFLHRLIFDHCDYLRITVLVLASSIGR